MPIRFLTSSLRHARTPARLAAAFLLLLITAAIAAGTRSHATPVQQSEGASIIGVIQDDKGQPVADAKVTITSLVFSASALTKTDGRFEFRNLKAGQYRLVAEAARFRKESITLIVARPDDALTPPPIRLVPSSLHVTVLDSGNQPLAGVALTVRIRDRASEGQAERRTTDEGGDAYFGRLSPGSYQLTATLRGYEEYRNDVFISAGITTEFPVQLIAAPVIAINEKANTRYGLPSLPSKNVTSLYQDNDGWMWFGTDKGIARFNGSDFDSSSQAGSPYEKLAGEEIRAITGDQSANIWIATSHDLRRISKAGAETSAPVPLSNCRQLLVDSRGTLWVISSDGLSKLNGKDRVHILDGEVRCIAEDRNGRLWVVRNGMLSICDGDSAIPIEVTVPATAGSRDAVLADVRQLFTDRGGNIWLATSRGAFLFTPPQSAQGPVALRAAIQAVQQNSGTRVICQDAHGRYWLALDNGGVLLFDADRNESQRIGFLSKDRIAAMLTSADGEMWFAGDSGAVQADLYSFVSFTASRGLQDNEVNEVFEVSPALAGSDARLWFFCSTGVSRFEGDHFSPVGGFRSNINVQAAALDAEGNAWFATEQGALRLTGQTLTQFNESTGLASGNVHWLSSIAGGSAIVFATSRGATVFRNGEMHSLDSLAGYDVRHVFEDPDGVLWFSTGRGVVKTHSDGTDAEIIDIDRGLADNDVRWIGRFGDRLLVATRGGIQTYNNTRGRLAFSMLDGDSTSTLFVDRDGYLWAGTDEGQLKKFGVVGGQLISTVYSGESCALSGSRINAISEDEAGNIWIATNRGAVRHRPSRIAPAAQVVLEVDGRAYPLEESETIEVPYGRHRFTFRFSAVSLGGQVRYLYSVKLQGGGTGWKVLPSQQPAEREVSLLELEEGVHSFELMALNRDLYGAARPAAAISLRIGLPFWKRWWFYSIGIVIVGLAGATFLAISRLRQREYILPRELRNYVPIEPNPYIVGNPIRTEAMFFGRQDDFRYVRTKLEGVSQGVVIVFCGERRVGKSSILYQVLNGRLGDRFIPVFVDLQEMVVSSDSELFARVSRLIADSLARVGPANEPAVSGKADASIGLGAVGVRTVQSGGNPRVPVPQFDGRNPYPIFLDFLDGVLASIGDRTLLILMDEYELLEGKVDEGKLSTEFFTFLAGLMDNRERLALIFTGSRRLEERDKKYWRELLRRSLFRKVGFLSTNDTIRLITEPVAGRAVYGRGVIEQIVRLTAGQPFYAQVICQNTVDYMNEHRQNWVTTADLEKVIREVVDNPLPQMIYTWDVLSDDEKLVLSLLGEGLPDGTWFATAFQLRASVKENDYPVNLSENTIRLTLEEMFRRELLEKDAADGFRFRIDLLRLWTRRSHSIWQVVKEVRTL